MLLLEPLFHGSNAYDTFMSIFSILGSPSHKELCEMDQNKYEYSFPKLRR